MKRSGWLLLSAGVILAGTAAMGEDAAADKAAARATARARQFASADADGNGQISLEEYLAARKAEAEGMFKRLDADGDGNVSEAEFTNPNPAKPKRAPAHGEGGRNPRERKENAERKGRNKPAAQNDGAEATQDDFDE